jgi:hypothetical protein
LPGDDTETGWTAGAGVEFAFDARWSVKLDYQHNDPGSERANDTLLTTAAVTRNEIEDHTDRGGIGLNYRFGAERSDPRSFEVGEWARALRAIAFALAGMLVTQPLGRCPWVRQPGRRLSFLCCGKA